MRQYAHAGAYLVVSARLVARAIRVVSRVYTLLELYSGAWKQKEGLAKLCGVWFYFSWSTRDEGWKWINAQTLIGCHHHTIMTKIAKSSIYAPNIICPKTLKLVAAINSNPKVASSIMSFYFTISIRLRSKLMKCADWDFEYFHYSWSSSYALRQCCTQHKNMHIANISLSILMKRDSKPLFNKLYKTLFN